MCQSLWNYYILGSTFALLRGCLESGEVKCAVPHLDTPRSFSGSAEIYYNLLTPAEKTKVHIMRTAGTVPQVPEGKLGCRTEERAASPAPEP